MAFLWCITVLLCVSQKRWKVHSRNYVRRLSQINPFACVQPCPYYGISLHHNCHKVYCILLLLLFITNIIIIFPYPWKCSWDCISFESPCVWRCVSHQLRLREPNPMYIFFFTPYHFLHVTSTTFTARNLILHIMGHVSNTYWFINSFLQGMLNNAQYITHNIDVLY